MILDKYRLTINYLVIICADRIFLWIATISFISRFLRVEGVDPGGVSLNPTGNCLCRSIRDIVDARAGTWHKYVYIPHHRLSFALAMYLYTCVCVQARARIYPHSGGDSWGSWRARVHTYSHMYIHTESHTSSVTRRLAPEGLRRPFHLFVPGVSPRNFQLSNNKVPGWPNYCRERAARRVLALRIDTS